MIGAVLGADFKIKKAKLRGVESFGMLCSAAELQISEANDGLLELAADAPVGEDIRTYLNLDDASIEVDLTPNRGDCLSVAGLAREVGALYDVPVSRPAIAAVPAVKLDYLEVRGKDLGDVPEYGEARLLVAAWVGTTRLIDNVGIVIGGGEQDAQQPVTEATSVR